MIFLLSSKLRDLLILEQVEWISHQIHGFLCKQMYYQYAARVNFAFWCVLKKMSVLLLC